MIDPRNIRRHSRAAGILRFWVQVLVQSVITLAVLIVLVWVIFALIALLHPPAIDLNIQLPTL